MVHKSGIYFFGMGLREIKTSSQDDAEDDAEDRYNLDGAETWKFAQESYKTKRIVRIDISIKRVQLKL